MTDGETNSSPEEDSFSEIIRKREVIMRKLHNLTQEEDSEIRKRLTHELTVQISEMMRENQGMKQELITFIRRLRG